MIDEFVPANGLRFHCVRSQPASAGAPLLLFLHGFPQFWGAWKAQLDHFGQRYLAVAPDLRGYNLSDKPGAEEAYRMKHLVADVAALAAHYTDRPFVLIGHDWGGAVAWAFAIAHSERLRRLVIINAPHPGVFQRELACNPAQQKASQYMLFFRTPDAEQRLSANHFEWLQRALWNWGAGGDAFSPESRHAHLDAWAQPGALTGGLNYYRANKAGPSGEPHAPLDPAALMVKVPTTVIWGEQDVALLPGNLDGLGHFVPQLDVHRIPDASHWVIEEQPDRVNRLIEDAIETS